ncbi:phosphatidylcholine/phosphatidylserine synthase [Rhodospirillaceae bacterium KN72]|uniref:Phosphatidylcholine/phosphatidylserine synthase n=1 Tax=Pacificispira spongiicola TaxID=2729598 RepID=A0A7Y0HE04_9PROT|nr:phosphatidylcholine/phosphatidylserine synthase [Pacificispira spongiicola]NMM44210.1 phosphatidylcholine/phosphatidylserine synthase [Pacificispira spongiicola]
MLKPTARKRRAPRLKGMTVARLIPNMITVAATCAGLSGIRFALDGRWEVALGAILVAAVLDALDGRMARLLHATSDFGAQLDSLSDFVAFGVSPALIMWLWGLGDLGGPGWGIALFFAMCCGLRLARFNSRLDKLPPYAYNYFQGIPAPAGAAVAMMPMALGFVLGDTVSIPPLASGIWVVAIALLMVSELPTYSFKKFKLAPRWVLPFMVTVGLALAGLFSAPWETLSLVGVVYLTTLPMSVRSFSRLKAEAERLQTDEPSVDEMSADEAKSDGGTGKDGDADNTSASIHPLRNS